MTQRVLSRGRLACLAIATAGATACSFALSFDECEIDEHCGQGGLCMAGVCRAGDGDGDGDGGEVEVTENITEDTVWDSENTYILTKTIYVEPGVTLTIRSGTTVKGEEGSALIVESGGILRARGTLLEPIVFTSAKAEGTRTTGDWGGVALLGRAPTNDPEALLEGVEDSDRATFGGTDPSWSCGTLEYVRIEFAGFPLQQDNELNGLTLGGCGSGTLIDYVQVHYGLDDGVEVFGGNVNLKHVVITRAQDDSLDWDLGWTGNAQFIAIQQDAEGDNGIEASSSKSDAAPRTDPNIWNITILGSNDPGASQRGITFKEYTAGQVNNALLMGNPIEAIDVTTPDIAQLLMDGELAVEHSLFFQIGEGGAHYFPTVDDEMDVDADDDGGFDEEMFFMNVMSLVFGEDPGIARPYDLVSPSWVPSNADAVNDAGTSPPTPLFDGFDEQANYAGAFKPGTPAWTDDWTAYPSN